MGRARAQRVGHTIHALFDLKDNRVAEYNAQTSTLLAEYVWLGGQPIAAISGGVVYFVRADHIGRPSFATDDTGAVVWDASYKPFGEVDSSTGSPINLRFPGQWFNAESELNQNWMRDYDPTLGRYIQADPLGLVGGASVYGYARQSPNRYTDPTGEFIPLAAAALAVGNCIASPVCRAGVGAATGLLFGYFLDDDNCYSWSEAASDAALGVGIAWGFGKAAAPHVARKSGGLFGRGGYFNSGFNRIGWGKHNGQPVFRGARGPSKGGKKLDFFND